MIPGNSLSIIVLECRRMTGVCLPAGAKDLVWCVMMLKQTGWSAHELRREER